MITALNFATILLSISTCAATARARDDGAFAGTGAAGAAAARGLADGRGLHWSTFQLNLSCF